MSRHTRRDFLKSATAAGLATGFTIAGTKASGQVLGANDRLRIAVCGLNGRGRSHAGDYVKMEDVELAYVVDPDTQVRDSAADSYSQAARLQGQGHLGRPRGTRGQELWMPSRSPPPITGTR